MKHFAQFVLAFLLVNFASSDRTFASKKFKETLGMAFFRENGLAYLPDLQSPDLLYRLTLTGRDNH